MLDIPQQNPLKYGFSEIENDLSTHPVDIDAFNYIDYYVAMIMQLHF